MLEEATVLEIVFDDDISDCVKHELDVVSIGGTSKMGIYLLGVFTFVQIFKLELNVCSCLLKGVRSCK